MNIKLTILLVATTINLIPAPKKAERGVSSGERAMARKRIGSKPSEPGYGTIGIASFPTLHFFFASR